MYDYSVLYSKITNLDIISILQATISIKGGIRDTSKPRMPLFLLAQIER